MKTLCINICWFLFESKFPFAQVGLNLAAAANFAVGNAVLGSVMLLAGTVLLITSKDTDDATDATDAE